MSGAFGHRTNGSTRIAVHGGIETDRAISTVADVTMALLLISASVMILAVFLESDDEVVEPVTADRTAETIGSTTISVEYSLEPVIDTAHGDTFEEVSEYEEIELTRVAHGPTAGMIKDAALANLQYEVDGGSTLLTQAGVDYERAVDEALQDILQGATDRAEITAVWQPYEGATIRGYTTLGQTPPSNVDVNSVSMSVPSGFPDGQNDALAVADTDYDEVGAVIASIVIEGYNPPSESQRALESSGLDRGLTVNRYERMVTLIDGADPSDGAFEANLDRAGANASGANAYLIDHLGTQFANELEDEFDTPEAAARAVSTGNVILTVRTWNQR